MSGRAALDGAVYVGRFQPPHAAHAGSAAQALGALGPGGRLLVLLGSANLARSVRNPFTPAERASLFRLALEEAGADAARVVFRPLPDRFDASRWAADVRAEAGEVFGEGARLALVGLEKDASSAYLRWFPGWARLEVAPTPGLNATDLRAALFTGQPLPVGVSPAVARRLAAFTRTPTAARLRREWAAVEEWRAASAPVLLHERRWLHVEGERVWLAHRAGPIGQGLWELPGEVLAPGEEVPAGGHLFDHPARALVTPSVAHVFPGPPPPHFAARPVGLSVARACPRNFHEDHGVILARLTGEGAAGVQGL